MTDALITGITGQDGSYLAELLLEKGYRVSGLVRPGADPAASRIAHLSDVELITGDLRDDESLRAALRRVRPREVYNLAAKSHVHASFEEPVVSGEVNGLAVTRLLESIKTVDPTIRFFQASTGEIFGAPPETVRSEATPLRPRSPYAIAKAYAYLMTVHYRETHGMHTSSGILFNHESPRRGTQFVTRKITTAVARIKHDLQHELRLGNIDARRDWGFAGDYVESMWLMLQRDHADDFVIASGTTHSVRDFCERAFNHAGLDYRDHVVHDESLLRPAEIDVVAADPSKANEVLGWKATVDFDGLIAMMVDADLELATQELDSLT